LLATARAVFHARNGSLVDQITRTVSLFSTPKTATGAATGESPRASTVPAARNAPAPAPEPAEIDGRDLSFWNGFGGFDVARREYTIRMRGGETTPQPWINVIANAHFGFHVSAEGGSYTWSRNSRDYQLTAWRNDPVIDR